MRKRQSSGLHHYITAEEVGALLEMMYRGTLVSEAASARMISIMKDQQLNHKIPYLIDPMPQAPQIATRQEKMIIRRMTRR